MDERKRGGRRGDCISVVIPPLSLFLTDGIPFLTPFCHLRYEEKTRDSIREGFLETQVLVTTFES